MSFYSVVNIFFSSTLLPSHPPSDQSLNSPPLPLFPHLLPSPSPCFPPFVLPCPPPFFSFLSIPLLPFKIFNIFCVFHNIHLCIICLHHSHKSVRLYNLLTQQCEIRKEKRHSQACGHFSSVSLLLLLSPQGWEESCDAAVSHLLRSCLSRSPKDQATSLAQTGGLVLGLPRDTARLKKHITLLCDRIGKGGRLTLASEANVQVPAQVQNLAAPGESTRGRRKGEGGEG